MIHLFYGDDAKKKLAGYEKFLKATQSSETFFISRNDFNKTQIESLYSGASLFSPLSTIVFEGILEREETRDFVLEKLDHFSSSRNLFIFLESKLTKPVTDAFKKAGAELNIFELPKEKKEKFDNFLLANAFSKKDKLHLWIYYRQAVDLGVGLEELTGVLFWKMKDMILKKDFSKFSLPELQNSAARVSYLLPEARTAGRDAELALEKFLLEVI